MSKFSLSKASGAKETKRPAEAAASGASSFKIPKVSEVAIEIGAEVLSITLFHAVPTSNIFDGPASPAKA